MVLIWPPGMVYSNPNKHIEQCYQDGKDDIYLIFKAKSTQLWKITKISVSNLEPLSISTEPCKTVGISRRWETDVVHGGLPQNIHAGRILQVFPWAMLEGTGLQVVIH